ncbi:MAG TPA: thioredoxin domain-containing protein [Candidatus Limnocylindrales bacterium]|nr:thioredoxin domain-containing protein [Candidatus Limnocylindrales bacterium]
MSAPQTVKTRRERRLAERELRRDAPRRPNQSGRRIGIGMWSLLAVIGGLAVIAIAVATTSAPPATPGVGVAVVRAPAGITTDGYVIGKADAPVTIDLFEDFQCPACESWGTGVFPRLAANELANGTAKLVFHAMAFIGPESIDAAHAGYAAAQQGRFWDMWATIYGNQGAENGGSYSRARLVEMATELGLDVAKFEADMDSPEAAAALTASIAEADEAGVSSTPTVVIGGQAYTGVGTYPDLAATIAAAASPAP